MTRGPKACSEPLTPHEGEGSKNVASHPLGSHTEEGAGQAPNLRKEEKPQEAGCGADGPGP